MVLDFPEIAWTIIEILNKLKERQDKLICKNLTYYIHNIHTSICPNITAHWHSE